MTKIKDLIKKCPNCLSDLTTHYGVLNITNSETHIVDENYKTKNTEIDGILLRCKECIFEAFYSFTELLK